MPNNKITHPFLKKGGGKLASDFHGTTEFALKRQQEIVSEQLQRERYTNDYVYNKKYNIK